MINMKKQGGALGAHCPALHDLIAISYVQRYVFNISFSQKKIKNDLPGVLEDHFKWVLKMIKVYFCKPYTITRSFKNKHLILKVFLISD